MVMIDNGFVGSGKNARGVEDRLRVHNHHWDRHCDYFYLVWLVW